MAIDDNTSYELTGAQVKDLANKIRSKAADNIFVGATSAIPGSKGLVPQPQAGDDTKFLSGDGLWKTVSQYNLPIASSSTLGGIKVGDNLTIDPVTGVLDADGSTYTAGNGINISANDEISVDTSVVAEVSDLPTKTSDLTNDGSDGTSTYVEADDLATVATSGSYNDLTNKPTIPTVNNATLTVQKNGTSVGTFTANASSNKTINITVPTTAADVSALPDTTKYGASILVSIDSTTYKLTTTLKDQDGNTLGTAQVVDLPLESVVVNGAYDSQTKEVVLTLVNGSTIRFSVADLVSGLQAEITSTNKLDADLVDDSTSTHKFTTAANLTKLAGIAAGAEVNVQSDWNVTNSSSDAFIKNKPTIPTVNNATLTIQKNGTNVQTFTANQSTNATANITVPTKTSDITNDSNFPVDANYVHTDNNFTTTLKNKLDGIATGAEVNQNAFSNVKVGSTTVAADSKTDTLELVAGSNVTLTPDATNDKVTIAGKNMVRTSDNLSPSADTAAAWNTLFNTTATTGVDVTEGYFTTWYSVAGKFTNQPSAYGFLETFRKGSDIYQRWHTQSSGAILYRSGNGSGWSNPSTGAFNTVATTAQIPTVNNATLTIQKNGTNVQTFTANQSTNATANITVPTATSDLTNDSNFVADASYVHTDNNFTTTLKNKLDGIASGAEVNVQSDWNVTNSSSDAFIKNKPTIPTVNNGTLTIQKNGTNVQTFTANQSGNATANITVPMGVYTATCSTAAATAAKDIVVPTAQNFELKAGATIVVKFTNTNTANNPTFNVNSTGAKSVYFNTGVITTGSLNRAGYANRYTTYTYDGTNWVWVSWGTDDNTTYSAMSVSEGTTGTATTSRVMRADYLKQIIQGVTPNITMTNTDPGAGSALAADHYVAVYGNSDGTIQTADIANGAVTSAKIGWASLAAGAMASTVVAGSSSTDNGWTVLRIANNVRIYMRYFTGSTTVGASSWGQDDLGTLPSSATSKTWFGFVSGKASDNAVSYTGTIWENGHVAMSKINNYNQQLTVTYEATAIAVVIGV